MRILLLGDSCGELTPWGRLEQTMLEQAPAAGHEVRRLSAADESPNQTDPLCHFATWTDAQLDGYRGRLRGLLDAVVERFNPDLIHAEHLWLLAHLALETGVPYVVSTWGHELPAYRADPRLRVFAEQAAENAGRILADSEATRSEIMATFGELDGRVEVRPEAAGASLVWLWQLYRDVVAQRHGEISPDPSA